MLVVLLFERRPNAWTRRQFRSADGAPADRMMPRSTNLIEQALAFQQVE